MGSLFGRTAVSEPAGYEIRIMGKLLTVRQTAEAFQLSEKAIRAMLADGRLGFVKIGRSVRVPESEILEKIARGHHPAA